MRSNLNAAAVLLEAAEAAIKVDVVTFIPLHPTNIQTAIMVHPMVKVRNKDPHNRVLLKVKVHQHRTILTTLHHT
jgi:hypothetical protein